jgi:Ran GTPase-activating protein 1
MQIITEATLGAKITSVDVSDNAFGEKGVRACSAMLQQQTGIESISFMNNGISEQAAAAILELLASPQSLKKFHLHKNMTGDEGTVHIGKLLEKAPHMEDFKMAGSRFTSDGAVTLAKGLASGTSLTKLDLTDNNVNEEGGIALATMLFKQPKMKHLNFEMTSLGPDASAAVASALAAGCPELEYLNLSSCDITPEGVPSVAKAISAMKNLKVLKIAENELGDFGVTQICVALKMSGAPIVELDVSTNELVHAGAVAAARLAAAKVGFTALNLDANYISDEGVEEVKSVLEGAGISAALMSMEENDADMADEVDDDQAASLNAMLDHLKI